MTDFKKLADEIISETGLKPTRGAIVEHEFNDLVQQVEGLLGALNESADEQRLGLSFSVGGSERTRIVRLSKPESVPLVSFGYDKKNRLFVSKTKDADADTPFATASEGFKLIKEILPTQLQAWTSKASPGRRPRTS